MVYKEKASLISQLMVYKEEANFNEDFSTNGR